MELKKISLESALYLVATPIGNLKDITIRALEVLNSADIVACEDTRVTNKLLNSYAIQARTTAYNDHSKKADRQKLISLLKEGKSVALVSDAGMPLISDPGYKLVKDCYDAGIKVTVCPGASSVPSAVTLSGLPSDSFYFGGFLPQNQGQKENFFAEFREFKTTLIFMDRASRLLSTVKAINKIFGNVQVVIVREITKLYEERISLSAQEMIEFLEGKELKGEIVILLDNNSSASQTSLSEDRIDDILKDLLRDNTVKTASEIAFLEHGINKKLAYRRLLELKD